MAGRKIALWALMILALLLIDQGTKHWAWNNPSLSQKPPGNFGLWNRANIIENRWEYGFFLFMNMAVPGVWYLEYRSGKINPMISLGFIFTWAGIIGNNLIDAFLFGYIRDFIWVDSLGCGNVADQQKYLGCAMIIGGMLLSGGMPKWAIALSMFGVFVAIALFFYIRWGI